MIYKEEVELTIPEGFSNDAGYLEHLTFYKAKLIYGDPIPEDVDDRLQFELEIIEKSGNSNYLLFLYDLVSTAPKELGALIGPGRGSVGGSLVAYCLGITKVDPLKYDLLFERCINPDMLSHLEVWIDVDKEGQFAILRRLVKKNVQISGGDTIEFEDESDKGKWKFTTKLVEKKALSEIKTVLSNIKQTQGIDVNLDDIPIDDSQTFSLFQKGDTDDVFCFDSSGMQQWLRYLHPTKFNELVILNVMYRPGIEYYIPQMLFRKCGKEKIEYPIPAMEKYLHETYGMVIYQEQIMLLSRLIADFNRGDSDTLREALCKKEIKALSVLKPKFIEGGLRNGHKKAALERVWNDWEEKGLFLFNKAHAVCYSWLGYQMAYLKANYPAAFQLL